MKRAMFVLAAAALLCTGAAQAAETFTFGFEGFPIALKALEGTELTFEGYLTVTSADIPIAGTLGEQEGIQGWSFGVQIDGATIDAAATFDPITPAPDTPEPPDTKGLDLKVDTLRQGTAAALTLYKAGFQVLEPAYADKAPHAGAPIGCVSAIVLNQTKKQILLPNTTTRIAKLTLKATVPGVDGVVHIEFKGGLFGSGEPVSQVVTYMSASQLPVNGALDIPIGPKGKEFMLGIVAKDVREFPGTENVMEVKGAPGSTVNFTVDVLLKTDLLPTDPVQDGPQGWSFGFANSPNLTADPTQFVLVGEDGDIPPPVQGVIVKTLRGGTDTTNGTPVDLDLAKAGFKVAEQAYGDKAPHAGAPIGVVTAIVLNQTKKQTLVANATDWVLRINYSAVIGETETQAAIDFQGGLYGSGEPVSQVITYQSASRIPTVMQGLKVKLIPGAMKANFFRGDANNDGKIDIADAVWIVYSVVPGIEGYSIPCSDAGDSNDDEALNLADAAHLITYEFLGGTPPAVPFGACGTDDDSTELTCPPDSTNCP